MPMLSAENSFKRGLAALCDERNHEAAAFFLAAMRIEQDRSVRHPDPRYLSYYGLSLARAGGVHEDALHACELAASRCALNTSVLLNLGRVYRIHGQTEQALECIRRGLAITPGNTALRRELDRTDRRGQPVFPDLGREHPINRWLGRLRARLQIPARDLGAQPFGDDIMTYE